MHAERRGGPCREISFCAIPDADMWRLLLLATALQSCDALRCSMKAVSRRDMSIIAGRGLALAAPLLGGPRLAAAAETPEIVTTILVKGDESLPTAQRAQTAVVDYTLWINDFEGKQIDSSKGSTFPPKLPSPFKFNVGVGQVIPGWDRTVREMRVGEKRRVVIPAELGYGPKGVGPIPGGANLYFEIELLELKPLPPLSEKQLEWLANNPEK